MLYSHGIRYPFALPALGLTYNDAPDIAPSVEVGEQLLAQGFALAGAGVQVQGWNTTEQVYAALEVNSIARNKYASINKVVAWGNSLGALTSQSMAEQYPGLFDAVGAMCLADSALAEITMAGDFLWGVKTFFDPTIKGGSYSAGTAGYAEAMGDLVKVFTVIGSLQAAFAANPSTPAWPATSKVPDAIKGIPSRSALVMVALMAGIPMQSAHFDSTSAPAGLSASSTLSFQVAINPAFAALENVANAAALAVLATHDLELQAGGAVFDNTATDYAARVADEQFIWASALSGNSGTAGLLSVLAASPRAKANPAAVEKLKTLGSHSGKVDIPTILFTGTADPVTTAGNQQSVVDKYATYWADKWVAARKAGDRKRPANNQLVLWNLPPEKYTKYTAAGAPDTSVPAASGTNHCNFTTKQYTAIAELLAYAADNGKHLSGGALLTKIRKAGNMTYDRGYTAPRLKYYGE